MNFSAILKHPVVQFAAVFGAVYFTLKNAVYALIAGAVLVGVSYGLSLAEFMSGSIVPDTDVFPGCETLVAADLSAAFGDDKTLEQTLANCGIMDAVTDANAPIIGTRLIYAGYTINSSCKKVHLDKIA